MKLTIKQQIVKLRQLGFSKRFLIFLLSYGNIKYSKKDWRVWGPEWAEVILSKYRATPYRFYMFRVDMRNSLSKNHITLRKLSRSINIRPSRLSEIEKGLKDPTLNQMYKISRSLRYQAKINKIGG